MAEVNPDRYLILATDPEEINWSILLQTTDVDEALDFWKDNKADPSLRIMINTSNFITFEVDEEESDG